MRLVAERVDAAVVGDGHVAADVTGAARAADRDVEVARSARIACRSGRFGERAGDCEAAVAAAAADALREHTVRLVTCSQDVARVGHVDGAAFAATATLAAHTRSDRRGVCRRRAGDAEAAVAAATADALCAHAVRLRTVRVDVGVGEDAHRRAVARRACGTADADGHLRRLRYARADAEAAVATAATEAQRRDAVRAAADRFDDAGDVVVLCADITMPPAPPPSPEPPKLTSIFGLLFAAPNSEPATLKPPEPPPPPMLCAEIACASSPS